MLKEYFKSIEDVSATEWLLCMLIAIMAAMLSINGDGMLWPRSISTATVMFCSPVMWTFFPGWKCSDGLWAVCLALSGGGDV